MNGYRILKTAEEKNPSWLAELGEFWGWSIIGFLMTFYYTFLYLPTYLSTYMRLYHIIYYYVMHIILYRFYSFDLSGTCAIHDVIDLLSPLLPNQQRRRGVSELITHENIITDLTEIVKWIYGAIHQQQCRLRRSE